MIEIKSDISISTEIKELKECVANLEYEKKTTRLNRLQISKINKLLTNHELNLVCGNIYKQKYIKNLDYEQLCGLYDILDNFMGNLKQTKDEIDIKIFFDKKKIIDLKKLKAKFKLLGCKKYFPNFDFKRFKELLENPPTRLKRQDGTSDEVMVYDKLIVTKYLYGIIQMVINEMDLLVLFTGGEGMGKSKECSQHMNLLHYLLTELKLITYDYNIKDMWFNTVQGYNQAEDKFFDDRFRILGLDEGNELNSQDWQNDEVKTFFQRMRRERERQRIKLISIPQLVELLKGVAISRANFIFYSESKDEVKTGTLDKGYTNFYIIPRNQIYSYYNRKILLRDNIITTLTNHLKDKNTGYKKLPNSILIKRYKSNFVWGFDKNEYKEYLKETNKTYSVSKGTKITDYQAFMLFKWLPPLKVWGFDKDNKKEHKQAYHTLLKFRKQVRRLFEEDPDKRAKFEIIYNELREKNLDKLNDELKTLKKSL